MSKAADRQFVEIRPMVPVEVVAVIDGWGLIEGVDRTKVVNQWLLERAMLEHRRAIAIANITRGNPPLTEPGALYAVSNP